MGIELLVELFSTLKPIGRLPSNFNREADFVDVPSFPH